MCCGLAAPIELKTKRPAKSGECPLGGIGLGCFERNIVHLARRGSAAFPGAMALADDCRAVRLHGDADPGDIDSKETAAFLAGKDTPRLNRTVYSLAPWLHHSLAKH